MVLVEKLPRRWNDRVRIAERVDFNAARRLIAVRRYRDAEAGTYHTQPGIPNAEAEDENGWVETFRYDWRGRQAVAARYGLGGDGAAPPEAAPLSQTHTFHDHSGRPVLSAVYGARAPAVGDTAASGAALNPAGLGADGANPTPAEIITAAQSGHHLRRLTQTIYNLRGQVEEQREFDVSDPSGDSYLATVAYYDHANRVIYSRSASGTVQTTQYDGLGRQIRTATGVHADGVGQPILELTSTHTRYGRSLAEVRMDDLGKPIEIITRERLHDADDSSLTLDPTNSVATTTFSWHDTAGRTVATASLGTGDPGNQFVNPSTPPVRPKEQPFWVEPGPSTPPTLVAAPALDGAKITTYEFDEQGRNIATVRPDGTRTENVYDALGQLLLVTENAWGSGGAGPDGVSVRRLPAGQGRRRWPTPRASHHRPMRSAGPPAMGAGRSPSSSTAPRSSSPRRAGSGGRGRTPRPPTPPRFPPTSLSSARSGSRTTPPACRAPHPISPSPISPTACSP